MRNRTAAIVFVTGLLWGSSAQADEQVKFALNWYATGDHAAYWVALEKGYYKQRGLDVVIENSKGSGDVITKVDAGRDDIGLADTAYVAIGLGRSAQVKIIGMVFDKTPLNIFSRKDAPIRAPKDAVGKTLAAPPGDTQRQMWPALAKRVGLAADAVSWANIEPSSKIAALAEKRVDGATDYLYMAPFYEKVIGADNLVTMPYSDFGFSMYSMSIITSEAMIKERPEVLKAFLEASYLGWRDVISDPKAAMKIFKKRVPEIDASVLGETLERVIPLLTTPRYRENGIGWIDRGEMCNSIDTVNNLLKLPKKVDCDTAFTTRFLTKVDLPATAK